MDERVKYRTIVMSDIHLGSKWSKANEATRFIKENSCETLILCGDIIDGWAIMRGSGVKWKREHTRFVKAILDIADSTRIIYLRGNHDDFLDRIVPLSFLNIEIVNDMIYTSAGRRYYVLHGDIFDSVTTKMPWLAHVGDVGYSLLLGFNKLYNRYRAWRGRPYRSIAREIKERVKNSISVLDNFESNITEMARLKGCSGVICGHIHRPAIHEMEGVTYLNSGDWVESLSALTEDHDGEWQIQYRPIDGQQKSIE